MERLTLGGMRIALSACTWEMAPIRYIATILVGDVLTAGAESIRMDTSMWMSLGGWSNVCGHGVKLVGLAKLTLDDGQEQLAFFFCGVNAQRLWNPADVVTPENLDTSFVE